MIRRYRFGVPLPTGAVVEELPLAQGAIAQRGGLIFVLYLPPQASDSRMATPQPSREKGSSAAKARPSSREAAAG